jgi:hypothetical protein
MSQAFAAQYAVWMGKARRVQAQCDLASLLQLFAYENSHIELLLGLRLQMDKPPASLLQEYPVKEGFLHGGLLAVVRNNQPGLFFAKLGGMMQHITCDVHYVFLKHIWDFATQLSLSRERTQSHAYAETQRLCRFLTVPLPLPPMRGRQLPLQPPPPMNPQKVVLWLSPALPHRSQ